MNGWEMLAVALTVSGVSLSVSVVVMTRRPKSPVDPLTNPKLSCFVRGLIRSMKETPGEWTRTNWDSRWRRHSSGVTLTNWGETWKKEERIRVIEHKLSIIELKSLSDAYFTYLQPSIDTESKGVHDLVEPRLVAERALFEKLGCPTQDPK